MKKLITTTILAVLCSVIYGQSTTILKCFNLRMSNVPQTGSWQLGFNAISKSDSSTYYFKIINETRKIYNRWNGLNNSDHLLANEDPSSRDVLAYRGTDYFEVHFAAKRFMDSTYKVNLIEEGKEAFKEQLVAKDKEYLKVLNKLRSMIDQQDFYLMLAYAKKLDRKILFVQINQEDEKGNFYLLIGDPKGFDMTDWTRSTYKILSSDEIPTNYVIQDKFDQF